jgi:hypothetical protein
VMDHHQTRHMFKLRLRGSPAAEAAEPVQPEEPGIGEEQPPVPAGEPRGEAEPEDQER